MIDEVEWRGLLAGRRTDDADIVVATIDPTAPIGGGSQPILILGKNGRRYWMKMRASQQGDRVPVTEQIVGRVGELIKAPTCHVVRLRIPADLAGTPVSGGRTLAAGIEHGSADVASAAFFGGDGIQRHRDENARRLVLWLAMYDWCFGNDLQGLADPNSDAQCYSHDNGHYLPGGPNWTINELRNNVDTAHELTADTSPATAEMAMDAARSLNAVKRENLVNLLSAIPASWNVSDGDLEMVGYFLERRAPQVATRLLQRFGAA